MKGVPLDSRFHKLLSCRELSMSLLVLVRKVHQVLSKSGSSHSQWNHWERSKCTKDRLIGCDSATSMILYLLAVMMVAFTFTRSSTGTSMGYSLSTVTIS